MYEVVLFGNGGFKVVVPKSGVEAGAWDVMQARV